MIDEHLKYIAGKHSRDLLRGDSNVAFKDLINQELPPYLWDYMNIILNPHLGGVTQIGNLNLDFTEDSMVASLEERLMAELVIEGKELESIVLKALEIRLSFILDPAITLSEIIFGRQTAESVPGAEVDILLGSLIKVIQHWNPRVTKAINVVLDFLRQHPQLPITSAELSRQLKSAIEKDFIQSPLPSIEASLLILKDLLKPAMEYEDAGSIDFSEQVNQILSNRGLMSWTPAIDVENELLSKPLDVDTALRAMSRLRLYRERGLLAADTEEKKAVDEEIESFTSFIEGVS